ncbi:hypothetical protein [Micromonospora humidisoli]|uniref:DUF4034 domain-containing protein n=1 Tax=Micromonospora humidisoli TaxID=2807622 RepID=A0ABS2JEB0_9ACTN|nr:hypothetical protein [Micromonospora humidisoli]MBM7084878.1 hypothetical protein [Micromonospora humidisoli]
MTAPSDFTIDPAVAYPELVPLRTALRDGDWPAARRQLTDLPAGTRTSLVQMSSGYGSRDLFESAVRADPGDTVAAAMLANRLVNDAWAVRTHKMAREVSREQFVRFHELLGEAERVTSDAVAHDDSDPTLWTVRLPIARGLEMGQAEVRRRYGQVALRDPHHLPAQHEMLQQLCPKWGGTLDRMHDFALQCANAAPEGAQNPVLIASAHFEHAATLSGGVHKYLNGREVADELRQAAQRSVFHPSFRRTVGWVQAHHFFAFVFGLMGDRATARRLFETTGNLVSETPWYYLGDPLTVYREHRERAMRKRRWW